MRIDGLIGVFTLEYLNMVVTVKICTYFLEIFYKLLEHFFRYYIASSKPSGRWEAGKSLESYADPLLFLGFA